MTDSPDDFLSAARNGNLQLVIVSISQLICFIFKFYFKGGRKH